MPTVTFFIDVAYEQAQQRMQFDLGVGEPDRMERSGRDFFERVRYGYLQIAVDEPERFMVIDGSRDRLEIHSDIFSTLEPLL